MFVWIDESAEETQLLKEISSWDKENCLCKANCATYLGDVVSGHPVVQFFYESREGSFHTGAPTLPIQMGCFCFVTTWPPKLTLSLGIGLGFRVRFSLGLVSLGLWLGLGLGGEVVRLVRWSKNGYTPANASDSSAFCVNYWVILFLNGSPAGATSFTCHTKMTPPPPAESGWGWNLNLINFWQLGPDQIPQTATQNKFYHKSPTGATPFTYYTKLICHDPRPRKWMGLREWLTLSISDSLDPTESKNAKKVTKVLRELFHSHTMPCCTKKVVIPPPHTHTQKGVRVRKIWTLSISQMMGWILLKQTCPPPKNNRFQH